MKTTAGNLAVLLCQVLATAGCSPMLQGRSESAVDRFPVAVLAILAFLLMGLLTSCATSGVTIDSDKTAIRSKAYADALVPFAAMSALAYEDDAGDDTDTAICRRQLEQFLTTGANPWERMGEAFKPGPSAAEVGLAYDVWLNRSLVPNVIVIAIRGTEFTQWEDWKSNFWWLTRFFSDKNQYAVAPSPNEAGRVFEHFQSQPDTVFITTGHSLGGGVAQGLMYAFPQVSQCYAFNPSPVTSFYAQTVANRDLYLEKLPIPGFPSHRTLRIYEKGEVLAYIRRQMRFLYPLDDKIMEVRWNFDPKHDTISKHSMVRLAYNILSVHRDPGISSPAVEYRPWWFRTPPSGLCSPDPGKVK